MGQLMVNISYNTAECLAPIEALFPFGTFCFLIERKTHKHEKCVRVSNIQVSELRGVYITNVLQFPSHQSLSPLTCLSKSFLEINPYLRHCAPSVRRLADRARRESVRNFRFGIHPYVRRRVEGVCMYMRGLGEL
jgi:hypothetical protein